MVTKIVDPDQLASSETYTQNMHTLCLFNIKYGITCNFTLVTGMFPGLCDLLIPCQDRDSER